MGIFDKAKEALSAHPDQVDASTARSSRVGSTPTASGGVDSAGVDSDRVDGDETARDQRLEDRVRPDERPA